VTAVDRFDLDNGADFLGFAVPTSWVRFAAASAIAAKPSRFRAA
jgi:DNA-directed RNA polymerase sigma subunit (sigma70/sigma32)